MESEARTWIAALRGSQQRLASRVTEFSAAQLRAPSYDPGWNVSHVLSHIGSQAEIAQHLLAAVLAGHEPPGPETFAPIWEVWDARSPEEQAAQCLVADAEHVRQLEQLTDEQLAGIHFQFFGLDFDAVGMVWLRLGEHAVHSWDVAVSFDDNAEVAPESVRLLVNTIPRLASRGRPAGVPFQAGFLTSSPEREFTLDVTDHVTMTEGQAGGGVPKAGLPAEALLRLVYGRLDHKHTPPVTDLFGHVDLDLVRLCFPGF
jgi:uncharacterized protein (TIGR03083 family)